MYVDMLFGDIRILSESVMYEMLPYAVPTYNTRVRHGIAGETFVREYGSPVVLYLGCRYIPPHNTSHSTLKTRGPDSYVHSCGLLQSHCTAAIAPVPSAGYNPL